MSLIILNVDEVMRTLSNDGQYPFVVNDKTVDIVRFALNTGFTDVVLDEYSALRVMYQRPGEAEVRAQTLTYYDTDGLRNYYDWQLLSADLAGKGTLTVALCILRVEDGDVEEWHTTPCQVRVLNTIHTDDSDEGDETITPTVAQRVAVLETMIQRVASGAPVVVGSVSEMTDTAQIYVLSTDGNWYYHNGSAWTAGGEYGAVATDTTLTQAGMPADAGAVGDAIEYLEDTLSVGFPTEAKQALLALLEKVAYVVEDGQDLYDALDLALNPPSSLRSITAAYTQSVPVYDNSSLDDLKVDLVVTAHYSDGTTQTVTAYTLSGTLTVGTSTITVTYANKTATFVTTVSAAPLPAAYQRVAYVQSDGASAVNLRKTINRGLNVDNSITKYSFEVDAELLDTQPNYSTNMLIATANDCWLGYNTSANAIGVGTSSGMTFSGSKTDRHSYTMQITADGNIVAERDDGARVTRAYTVASGTASTGLLGVIRSGVSDYRSAAKIYSYKMYYDGELIRNLVPCYRKSDDVVGLYDMVNDNYFYTPISGAFTKGADVT